jgi:hypothetical protein
VELPNSTLFHLDSFSHYFEEDSFNFHFSFDYLEEAPFSMLNVSAEVTTFGLDESLIVANPL